MCVYIIGASQCNWERSWGTGKTSKAGSIDEKDQNWGGRAYTQWTY